MGFCFRVIYGSFSVSRTTTREYHYGPDKATEKLGHNEVHAGEGKRGKGTNPPDSTFKKLAPSKNRYTLLRDEL